MGASHVLDDLALMVWFGAGALFGLAIIRDFRGVRSRYEHRYPEEQAARKQARNVALASGWALLMVGSGAVIALLFWMFLKEA
jgi:hypothetical protein